MLQALIGPVAGLLDKFIPDADEKMKIAAELSTMAERHAQELAKGQLEVNKAEASSGSIFVAGWRPAVGWVCVLGMAMNFLIVPLGNFGLAIAKIQIVLPLIDTSTMMPVLMGMLGLGGLRTVEKLKNVSREK
jgi:hypothetical protein